jgi:hypothetical protein
MKSEGTWFKGCTMNEKLHDGCHIDKIITNGWKLHNEWKILQKKLHNWWFLLKKFVNEKPRKKSQNGWQIEKKCCIMDENLDLYNDEKFN